MGPSDSSDPLIFTPELIPVSTADIQTWLIFWGGHSGPRGALSSLPGPYPLMPEAPISVTTTDVP